MRLRLGLVLAGLLVGHAQAAQFFGGSSGGGGGTSGAVDSATVGGRALSTIIGDTVDALNAGLVADCATDNTSALNTAMAAAATKAASSGGQVAIMFPSAASCYGFNSAMAIPAGVQLVGNGRATLSALGSQGALFTVGAVANITLRNLRIDSRAGTLHASISPPITMNGSGPNITIEDVDFVNPTGGINLNTSHGVTIERISVTSSLQHGVYMNASYDNKVLDSYFQSEAAFGVILTGGSYRNVVARNTTTSNAIELVGVTQDSYENIIEANHAEGTGDNCISITGYKNIVVGNEGKGCAGNGIELYGDRNTVTGNVLLNNNQGHSGNAQWRGGIAIQGAFGGTGQYNIVTGNLMDDDQASATQQYGIWESSPSYAVWAASTAYSAGAYYTSGLGLYKVTTAGTSSTTAPALTTMGATASDGSTTTQLIHIFVTDINSDYNEKNGNVIKNAVLAKQYDSSGGHGEFIGGFNPVTIPSPLIVSQVSNPGGVGSIGFSSTGYQFVNSTAGETLSVSAPTGAGGGQTATAHISVYMLLGFGAITGGAGCTTNDVLTISGGTASGTPTSLRITGGTAGAYTFTANAGSFLYTVMPPSGALALTGGTCTTEPTLTSSSWKISTIVVDTPGSNYTSVPTIGISPSVTGTLVFTPVLSGAMTINAGVGNITLSGSGTTLGASNSPVINAGVSVDSTGVRVAMTGTAYTVPAGTSLMRWTQTGTIASQTATLPSAVDGQVLQIENYAGQITALTFSPAVNGWTAGSTFSPNTGLRLRYDGTAGAWQREG